MSQRFTLRPLEYPVAVADCGAVAVAAGRVNVSSPSISAAKAQLEAACGLHLAVRRQALGLALTEGGRQFTAQARAVPGAAGVWFPCRWRGPVRGKLIGLLRPKGAAPRRTLTAFLDHCRVHLSDAALPGHPARTGST